MDVIINRYCTFQLDFINLLSTDNTNKYFRKRDGSAVSLAFGIGNRKLSYTASGIAKHIMNLNFHNVIGSGQDLALPQNPNHFSAHTFLTHFDDWLKP